MQFLDINFIISISQDIANQFYNHPKMDFECSHIPYGSIDKKYETYTKSEAYLRPIFELYEFLFNSGKYPDYKKNNMCFENKGIEKGKFFEFNSHPPYLENGLEEWLILNKYKQYVIRSLIIIPLQYINVHTMEMIPQSETTCPNCGECLQKQRETKENLGSNEDIDNRDRTMWRIKSPFDKYPMLEEKCSLILPESIEVPFVASEEKILRSDGWYKVYHLSANN